MIDFTTIFINAMLVDSNQFPVNMNTIKNVVIVDIILHESVFNSIFLWLVMVTAQIIVK